uniref:Protein deacetylase HDAC6 n=1 Tax=Chrysemys picta bellii TaxID=8478 RepID=A0A8C3HW15_CHRPI
MGGRFLVGEGGVPASGQGGGGVGAVVHGGMGMSVSPPLSAPCVPPRSGGPEGPQPRRSPGLPETKRRGRAQRMNKEAEELESGLQRLVGGTFEGMTPHFYPPLCLGFPFSTPKSSHRGLPPTPFAPCGPQNEPGSRRTAASPRWASRTCAVLCAAVPQLPHLRSGCISASSEPSASPVCLHSRPPGHHAHRDKMDGYCMFNHLAIGARYARQKLGVERVLIVDWDVHHGQGTQFLFEEDPSVLYFSVHRYEQGRFWPHLPASDSPAVGQGRGEGFNINVPWNAVGMRDGDYLAAFLHVLLPVAFEFQPQLVLVAAGFDSVLGDPKGEMAASAACFAHLTHLLMALAGGKVLLSLEGGYNLSSLAEGVCAALRTLLGDPCPRLEPPVAPCRSALSSVSRTLAIHEKYWRSLRRGGESWPPGEDVEEEPAPTTPPDPREVTRPLPAARTGLVYDERMTEHYNMWDRYSPDSWVLSRLWEGSGARIPGPDSWVLCLPCSLAYVQTVKATAGMKPRELHRQGDQYNSIYICASSYECARLAAGSAFNAVRAVLEGEVQNAVAIVRPPGHHAESDTACGFCFFNSVALAARFAQRLAGRPMKVMILDWDVHHGNGTQHMFEEDPSVLYVSLHRYDHGTFFPTSEDADADQVGKGPGRGFTLNVPWNGPRMGDAEYLAAFHRLVLPVAYQFAPELVLVSAGFDAARGDPLGGYLVSPEGYAHMTHLLLGLAGGRVVLVLEGGYNLVSISESMTMCTRTLLGDPLPELGRLQAPHPSALHSLARASAEHRRYWACLRLDGKCACLPARPPPFSASLCTPPTPHFPACPPPDECSHLVLCWGPGRLGSVLGSGRGVGAGGLEQWGLGARTPGFSPRLWEGRGAGGLEQGDWEPGRLGLILVSLVSLQGTLYAVTPLPWCPHLDSLQPLPPAGLDVLAPCEECGSQAENWVCLDCYRVLCGRYVNQHMLAHGSVSGHPLVLSYADLSVWCYTCQSYVHHPTLLPAKALAHRMKFGEDPATGL